MNNKEAAKQISEIIKNDEIINEVIQHRCRLIILEILNNLRPENDENSEG